jgi:hypothetical protein
MFDYERLMIPIYHNASIVFPISFFFFFLLFLGLPVQGEDRNHVYSGFHLNFI